MSLYHHIWNKLGFIMYIKGWLTNNRYRSVRPTSLWITSTNFHAFNSSETYPQMKQYKQKTFELYARKQCIMTSQYHDENKRLNNFIRGTAKMWQKNIILGWKWTYIMVSKKIESETHKNKQGSNLINKIPNGLSPLRSTHGNMFSGIVVIWGKYS